MKKLLIFLMACMIWLLPIMAKADFNDIEFAKLINRTGLPYVQNKIFYVDPRDGADANKGQRPDNAYKTLQKAYNACDTLGGNTIVVFSHSGGVTAQTTVYTDSIITWTKGGIFVIGLCAEGGYFQRARISTKTKARLSSQASVMKITGANNTFTNLLFINEDTLGYGGVEVAADRNCFVNCHMVGGTHTACADSIQAYSLKLTSANENRFKHCTFGSNSIARNPAADQGDIWLSGSQGQNFFEDCKTITQSDATNYHGAILLGAATTLNGWTYFTNCIFSAWYASKTPNLQSVVQGTAQNNTGMMFKNCALIGYDNLDAIDTDASFGIKASPSDSIGYMRAY